MSSDASTALLMALLDGLTLVQGQLDKVAQSQDRIEAAHKDIMTRLDTIDAGQAAVTDLVPILETILARSIEDRTITHDQLATVATVAGFAHEAAKGNPAPLPVDVVDDPLLERFAIDRRADRISNDRALAEWRTAASNAGTAELVELLIRQYQPSPTDSAETRVLRYQLAAITRAEIKGRKVAMPPVPTTTRTEDHTTIACETRSQDLARLWRAGESTGLFADPELAGALDLFAEAEWRSGPISEEQLSAELAQLHRSIAARLSAGERPSIGDHRPTRAGERAAEIAPDRQR